jgi:hypothetical protein
MTGAPDSPPPADPDPVCTERLPHARDARVLITPGNPNWGRRRPHRACGRGHPALYFRGIDHRHIDGT